METEKRKTKAIELAPLARLAFHRTRDLVGSAVRQAAGEEPSPDILAGVTASILTIAVEHAARDALELGADPGVLACVLESVKRSEQARAVREYDQRAAEEAGTAPRIVAIGIIRADGTIGQA